jgi:hypothetical protein
MCNSPDECNSPLAVKLGEPLNTPVMSGSSENLKRPLAPYQSDGMTISLPSYLAVKLARPLRAIFPDSAEGPVDGTSLDGLNKLVPAIWRETSNRRLGAQYWSDFNDIVAPNSSDEMADSVAANWPESTKSVAAAASDNASETFWKSLSEASKEVGRGGPEESSRLVIATSSDFRKSYVAVQLWDRLKRIVPGGKLVHLCDSDVTIISDALDRAVGMKRSDDAIFEVESHSLVTRTRELRSKMLDELTSDGLRSAEAAISNAEAQPSEVVIAELATIMLALSTSHVPVNLRDFEKGDPETASFERTKCEVKPTFTE